MMELIFFPGLLSTTFIVGTLVVVITIVRRIWFNPLSPVPGPWLGKFSDIITIMAVYRKSRTFVQYDLLKKYGSPVRVGTNHLVYGDIQSWADIYGQSSNPCLKDEKVYNGFSVTGAVNILNIKDRAFHSRLRRLVANSFSARALLESQPMMQRKVQEYMRTTFDGHDGQAVDILSKTNELYLDIVSQLSFGRSFNCLSGETPTARRDVAAFFEVIPAVSFAPIMRFMPIESIREGLRGIKRLEQFSRAHVDAYLSGSTGKLNADPEGRFLHNLATAVDPETGSKMTREELVENTIIFLTAGSGTTAATAIYLIWECGQNEVVRRRLIDEIRTQFPDPNTMPDYEQASQLVSATRDVTLDVELMTFLMQELVQRYLSCVIEETLRLRGPLSISNPRLSPGKMLSGQWVPEGVTVETCAYAASRDPNVFPDPLRFDPSRWENPTAEMKLMSRPFSYGPRNCVGRHLAEITLTLTVARLYQVYDVVPDKTMTLENMKQEDKGVLEPGCAHFYVVPTAISKRGI